MKILAYRFSSFGDVALVVPVIRSVIDSNNQVEITFVSRKIFEPLFHDIPRFNFYGIDLDNYGGVLGLRKLYRELAAFDEWDYVLDLHSVMRSWVLTSFFRFANVPVYSIDKGRREKKQLTRKTNKKFVPLKHSTERTMDVFRVAGIKAVLETNHAIHADSSHQIKRSLEDFVTGHKLKKESKWIALAPFSKHIQKEWSMEKVTQLVQEIVKKGYTVFLFGAGEIETMKLKRIADQYDNVINLAGNLELEVEILLLEDIDVMISMDSFNLHLAGLAGVRVVSIWGATHPFAGFGPLNDNDQYIVQRDDLTCRPCSVFGNKPCFRGDLACLDMGVGLVINALDKALR